MSKAIPAAEKPRWLRQFEAAEGLVSRGESRAAAAPLGKALELNPSLAAGWRLLGDIAMAAGDFAGARRANDRRISSVFRDADLRTASRALAENRLDDAARILGEIPATRTGLGPTTRHLTAEVLHRRGRLLEAELALRACLIDDPELYEARATLARVLFDSRRFDEALDEFDHLLTEDGADVRSLAMKAAALTEIGRYDEAAAVTEAVLERFPDQPYAWLVHAGGLRALGQTTAAIAAYGKCLELDPRNARAWLSLANLKTYRFTSDQVAAMAALLSKGLGPQDQAELHFALGKAEEDAGAFAAAFDHYGRGNALEASRRAYDPAQTSAFVQRSKALFTTTFFAARAGWGAPEADPIFIVGLPRSGSTLVEQILASHPAIEGADELADLPILAGGVGAYPAALATLSREACARLGAEYLRRTRARRRLGRPRFIDKTPKNFLHLGFLRLILPQAKIIDVRRHPLACGVSVFKQHFGHGFGSAFDLGDIGRYYADYVSLMAHFDRVDRGAVHRVIYEGLVGDTETEVRRLLNFLGLPYDAACLRFFENRRPVDTPSSEQVRRPIFADGLDHWRHFEPWLGPLKSALGPVLDAYPDAPNGWDQMSR